MPGRREIFRLAKAYRVSIQRQLRTENWIEVDTERGFRPSAPLPCQPAPDPFLHLWSQPGPIVGIATLTNGFGLRRVGVNDRGQFAQTEASRHRDTDFTDHLPGMTRYDGCAEDFIPAFPDMQFHKT